MSSRLPAFVVLSLILVAVACSGGGPPAPTAGVPEVASPAAKVEAVDVAERLLAQLRDEDYTAAYATLSTGLARDLAANGLDLMTKLMTAHTRVRDWSLEKPTYISVDEISKVVVAGSVTFADGATGRVRIVMMALGLQADPWRIDEFELTRD